VAVAPILYPFFAHHRLNLVWIFLSTTMTLVVACFIAELFYALKTWESLACGLGRVNTFLKKGFIFFPATLKSSSHGRSRENERGGSSDYSQPDTRRSVRTALIERSALARRALVGVGDSPSRPARSPTLAD